MNVIPDYPKVILLPKTGYAYDDPDETRLDPVNQLSVLHVHTIQMDPII